MVDDNNKIEKARDQYEAMVAARKMTADSTSWLDRALSNIESSEAPPPAPKGDSDQ